jgi:hypothetical protein
VLLVMLAAVGAVVWKQTRSQPPPLREVTLIDGPYSQQDCDSLVLAWKRLNGNRGRDRARKLERECLRAWAYNRARRRDALAASSSR